MSNPVLAAKMGWYLLHLLRTYELKLFMDKARVGVEMINMVFYAQHYLSSI